MLLRLKRLQPHRECLHTLRVRQIHAARRERTSAIILFIVFMNLKQLNVFLFHLAVCLTEFEPLSEVNLNSGMRRPDGGNFAAS